MPRPTCDTAQRCIRRHRAVQAVRQYFDGQGFVEVDTAVAQTAPAPEAYIDAPKTTFKVEDKPLTRYLQTSPELPMKRLLAAGIPCLYQIAPCFRDGDMGPWHRPEFRLLEWYRRQAPWEVLLDDCEGLLKTVARAACNQDALYAGPRRISLAGRFERLSVADAFAQYAGFSLLDNLTIPALRRHVDRLHLMSCADDSWDDLFHRIHLTCIQPHLDARTQPVFLVDYPAPLASLARLSPLDPRCSERFELFVGGIELANGFGELNDAVAMRQRFVEGRASRAAMHKNEYPLDERFLLALQDLPEAAGIALGLDRLTMLLYGAQDMDQVACLPWEQT